MNSTPLLSPMIHLLVLQLRSYIFIIGLLLPAYSFTGFDGPAHMAEETFDAATSVPRAIVWAVLYMIVFGWIWILSLLFCIYVSIRLV